MNRPIEIALSLSVLAGTLTGCSPDQPKPVTQSRPSAAASLAQTETPRTSPNPLSAEKITELSTLYPELGNTKPKESGSFQTSDGSNISWLNYSEGKFNYDALKAAFDFFLTNPVPGPYQAQLSPEGPKEVFTIDRMPAKDSVIFVISENDPGHGEPMGPRLILLDFDAEKGETLTEKDFRLRSKKFLLYTRFIANPGDALFPSKEDYTTYNLAYLACNKALIVNTTNISAFPDLQENLCVSLALMFTAKQKDPSYTRYRDRREGNYIPNTGARIQTFPQEIWDKVPRTGRIISSSSTN